MSIVQQLATWAFIGMIGCSGAAADPIDAATSDGQPACGDPQALIPSWVTAYEPEQEIYVSPSGDNGKDGLSPSSALQTTAAAIARIGPGVRLNFGAGTYACD